MDEKIISEMLFQVVEKNLYTKTQKNYKIAPSHRAIINTENGNLISVVSNSYKLITNQKAIEYGRQCMKELFDIKDESEIKLFNIQSPKTKSFCHIDFIAERNNFKIIKDDYKQFVRVTNSYNRSHRLSFKVGFCRAICLNGIVFDDQSIRISISHTKSFKDELDFNIRKSEFDNLKRKFVTNISELQNYKVDKKYLFALFCKALDLKFNADGKSSPESKENTFIKLERYKRYFNEKYKHYEKTLGDNLYTLFNVITHYSTHSDEINKSFSVTYNSNQRRAGKWLFEISEEYRKGINYENYLKGYERLVMN